jgi:hypothetical protein
MLQTEVGHFSLTINPLTSGDSPISMRDRSVGGERLRRDIDELKDPRPYKDKYESREIQALTQAIDILWRLARDAHEVDATTVGLDKLTDAKIYLDKLLKQEFREQEDRAH